MVGMLGGARGGHCRIATVGYQPPCTYQGIQGTFLELASSVPAATLERADTWLAVTAEARVSSTLTKP